VLLASAIILGIAAVIFILSSGGVRSKLLSRFASQPQIHSLAVLPLTNFSGDLEQEYFTDAMTDELMGELSRINSLSKSFHELPSCSTRGRSATLSRPALMVGNL